jgi:hypothetical protein
MLWTYCMVSLSFVNGRFGDIATWWRTTGACSVIAGTTCIIQAHSLRPARSTTTHLEVHRGGMHVSRESERLTLSRFTDAAVDIVVEFDAEMGFASMRGAVGYLLQRETLATMMGRVTAASCSRRCSPLRRLTAG